MRIGQYLRHVAHSLFRSAPSRPCRRSTAKRFRPQLEALEDRRLLSTFTVVLASDNGGLGGQEVTATTGDLRYCVAQADAAHTATSDTIGFSSLFSTPQTITLNGANEELVLQDANPLSIAGSSAGTVTVSGGGTFFQVFFVESGTVTINHLTIAEGNADGGISGGNGGGVNIQPGASLTLENSMLYHDQALGVGGAIYNGGTLTLTNCVLSHDSAPTTTGHGGGGIWNDIGATAKLTNDTLSNDVAFEGGGIDNFSTLTLTGCTLTNDTSFYEGGGIDNHGTATVSNSTLSSDSTLIGGGAIFNSLNLTLTGSTLGDDVASGTATGDGGGGICNLFSGTATLSKDTLSGDRASYEGGGIYNVTSGKATLTTCTLTNDSAASIGGGIENDGTATLSTCNLNNDSSNDGGAIYGFGTATLTSCTISNDVASESGGGIADFGTDTLTKCTLSTNSAVYGGGIINGGTATLTSCTFGDNSASSDGGAIWSSGTFTLKTCSLSFDSAAEGGGIFLDGGTVTLTTCTVSNEAGSGIFNDGGTATLTNSTLSNNSGSGIDNNVGTATLTACTLNNNTNASGGGGAIVNYSTLTLTNCTLSSNSSYDGGGAIFNDGTANVINCTISLNSCQDGFGGGIDNYATLNLTNTIVAGNIGSSAADIYFHSGSITTDHDLIGDGTLSGIANGGGNLVGTTASPINPDLGPLQNNGGLTQTMALLTGSPAIGQADDSAAPHTDQRGHVRTDHFGEHTDIGAYEYP